MKLKSLLILFLFSLCSALNAQSISASVNKTVAEVDEPLQLIISMEGMNGDIFPQLPSLPNFNVYYQGFGMETQEGTGQPFKIILNYSYRLVPRFEGKAVIEPVSVSYLGKVYTTNPINIDVYKKGQSAGASAPAQQSARATTAQRPEVNLAAPAAPKPAGPAEANKKYESVFLMAKTNKKEAYVGEQITLNVGFYTALAIYEPMYIAPVFDGLTKEDMDTVTGTQYLGGKEYGYTLMSTALFGATAGVGKVGAGSVSFVGGSTGNSMLDSFFGRKGTVKSEPIDITIKPLPAGAGDHFYGAVGEKFSIKADIDKSELEVSDAATITLTVRGVGNLKTISKPKIKEIDGLKLYDVAGITNVSPVNGALQGYKTFKTVVVPTMSGEYTFPGVEFTYFSPAAQKYITVKSGAVNIKAVPSRELEGGTVLSYAGGAAVPGAQALNSDINYIQTNALGHNGNILTRADALGYINIIPFIALFLAGGFRALLALGVFERPVNKAKKMAKSARDAQELSRALNFYLAKKTGLAAGGMVTGSVTAALSKRGVKKPAQEDIVKLFGRLNAFKYAPSGAVNALEFTKLKQDTLRILRALEREIK